MVRAQPLSLADIRPTGTTGAVWQVARSLVHGGEPRWLPLSTSGGVDA